MVRCKRCNKRPASRANGWCGTCYQGVFGTEVSADEVAAADWLGVRLRQAAIRSTWHPAERWRRRSPAYRIVHWTAPMASVVADNMRTLADA